MAWRWALRVLASVAVGCGTPDDRAGQPCSGSDGCDGLDCIAAPHLNAGDLEPLALVCGGSRRSGREAGHACERAEQCASGICALAGACVAPCEGAPECSKFERCQRVYARGEWERLHPVQACVAMVDLPAGADVRVETHAAAFSGGLDELVLRPLSADTLFVIEHLDDDTWPVPAPPPGCRAPLCAMRLAPREPRPELWFDRTQLTAAEGPINPVAIGDHVYPVTLRVPSGPRARPSNAGYTLAVQSNRGGAARVTALAYTPSSARLDLNLYYVGTDARAVAETLDEVERILAQAGIFLGEQREIHVTGELLERGSDLPEAEVSRGFARLKLQYGVYPQLPELFKLSAGAGNGALDVFFVRTIEGANANVGGIAGGTPVPFGMHGTGASGVVIATDSLALEPSQLGRRFAHELGHALGLFHTTETNGEVFDPLDDTPACPDGIDTDACALDNLMFPTTETRGSVITADQAEVLRRAMVLR